MNNVEDKIK
jgi:membrane protein involved in colicin uptake